MNKCDKAFYSGIMTALCLIDLHGQDTIYDELVAQCNKDELVAVATEEGELGWSGLAKHGYAQQSVEPTLSKRGGSARERLGQVINSHKVR